MKKKLFNTTITELAYLLDISYRSCLNKLYGKTPFTLREIEILSFTYNLNLDQVVFNIRQWQKENITEG